MSSEIIIATLIVLLLLATLAGVLAWRNKRRLARRLTTLSDDLVAVSDDASVGRRLSVPGDGDIAQLAETIPAGGTYY